MSNVNLRYAFAASGVSYVCTLFKGSIASKVFNVLKVSNVSNASK